MISRRRFLKTTGALGASAIVAPGIIRAENLGGQKLRIAQIGAGGRGRYHIKGLEHEEIVALCDVDLNWATREYRWGRNMSFDRFSPEQIPIFQDYRVMLDKMGEQIDAVSIAVPDHMHYPIALWAMAAGKHILCEKPLVRTFEEAMLLKTAATNSGVVTQMGNQGHAYDGVRDIEEWIDAGLIGEVAEVYHWTDRPLWPQGLDAWPIGEDIPANLDWNLWLGVAPKRAYSSKIAPFNWRGFHDYGAGAIGDIACHSMDASYTPLKLGFPSRVWSDVSDRSAITFPSSSTIYFEFPANERRGGIKMTWMDGGRRPKDVPHVPNDFILANAETNKRGQANGTLIVGSKGAIFADMYAKRARIFPDPYFREIRKNKALPPKTLARVKGGHFQEWIDAVKNGRQPGGNLVDYAADFTGTALLGAISLSFDESLDFDSQSLRFTNKMTANKLLKSQYSYREEFLPG